MLASSVTPGEPLKQMYASTQLPSGQERSLVILEIGWLSGYLVIFCRNATEEKKSVHFWAMLDNSAVRPDVKQINFFKLLPLWRVDGEDAHSEQMINAHADRCVNQQQLFMLKCLTLGNSSRAGTPSLFLTQRHIWSICWC